MRDPYMTAYSRASAKLLAMCKTKPKRTICFNGRHVITGTKSIHRAPIAQRWRTFWRIKARRITRWRNVSAVGLTLPISGCRRQSA